MGKDYYKILGVEKGATQEDIKKAFRRKAHQHHPDKAGGNEDKFKEANEAYQVLGDTKKRAQYDQFGSTFEQARGRGGFSGFEGFRNSGGFTNGFNVNMDDIGDIFGDIGDIFGFSSRGGRSRTSRVHRGRDMQMFIDISFNEAVFGVEKEIKFAKNVKCTHCRGNGAEPGSKIETCSVCGGSGRVARVQRTILGSMQVQMTCEQCDGEGKTYAKKCSQCGGSGVARENAAIKVKIPAGIDDGETIRLFAQGEAGEKGAPAGNLYLKVRVKPDKRFERSGYDIRSKVFIGFKQAALGDKIEVETVDGMVNLKIPAGTQSGTVFKLRAKGVTKLRGSGRGDHFAEIIVRTPTSLSRKQKQLLEEAGV